MARHGLVGLLVLVLATNCGDPAPAPPDSGVAQDSRVANDTGAVGADATELDTATPPPDTAPAPDTGVTPPDTGATPPDSGVPFDSGVAPVDTGRPDTRTGCTFDVVGGAAVDDCTGNNLCICTTALCPAGSGECNLAFGRNFGVRIVDVTLPTRAPSGDCWDPLCGAPDPLVTLTVDGTPIVTARATSDVFTFTWTPAVESAAFTVRTTTQLRLDVYDEDVSSSDGAFACVFDPITITELRARMVSCSGALGTLRATIVPVL